MIVNQEKIDELTKQLEKQKEQLTEVDKQLKWAGDNVSLGKILEAQKCQIRSRIRGLKQGIKWEEERYNYLTRYEDKLKELAPYLGKEVKSPLRSTKGTPQILLGIYWKEGVANYSSSAWVGLIRYTSTNYDKTAEVNIKTIERI